LEGLFLFGRARGLAEADEPLASRPALDKRGLVL
jgi:hypothetical protein